MHRIVLTILALALTACGPSGLELVDSIEYGGITIQSEVRFNYDAYPGAAPDAPPFEGNTLRVYRVKNDIERVRETFDRLGILPEAEFATRFGKMPIYVRQDRRLENGANGQHFHSSTGAEWIELPRGGGALGHELMHTLGVSNHDSQEHWDDARFQAADDYFIQWSGGWYIITVPVD